MIRTIYIDMDGVLTDFRSYIQLQNVSFQDPNFTPWWSHKIATENVFEILPPNPYIRELDDLICFLDDDYNVEILTSYGGNGSYEKVEKEKKNWLTRYLPKSHDLIGYNGVVECKNKWLYYANADTFLIDDRSHIVNNFQKHGGNSYHYDIHRHKMCVDALVSILL